MRPPFSYVGGKAKIAKRLLPYLAVEEKMYVEPYFGAGGIFFAKLPAPTEYINDVNGDVVNFMRVLRDHPHDLLRLCQLTPYARDEYYRCRNEEWPDTETHEGRLEAARRFWVLAKQGRASPNRADGHRGAPGRRAREARPEMPIEGERGWNHGCNKITPAANPATEARNGSGPIDEAGWKSAERKGGSSKAAEMAQDIGPIDGEHGWDPGFIGDGRSSNYAQYTINFPHLLQVAQRLQGVTIDNRDALKIIERYDRPYAFLYLDPPYLLSTRRGNLYKHEMSDEQHVDLLEAALAYTGKVAISGYANDLYDIMLADWLRIEIPTKLSIVTNAEGKKNERTEILWTNYRKQPTLL